MTAVYLYGHLGRTFGWRWSLDVHSPAEAVRAIIANRPDFQRHLIKHSEPGYRVFIGADPIADGDGLHHPVGRQCIKIVPVVAGGKEAWINIVVGVVIIAATIAAFQWYALPGEVALLIGGIGASLAINGVSQMLMGTPNAPEVKEREQNKPSFLFTGPVNTIAQGHPVPVGYGRLRVGSAVVSAGIVTEDIAI